MAISLVLANLYIINSLFQSISISSINIGILFYCSLSIWLILLYSTIIVNQHHWNDDANIIWWPGTKFEKLGQRLVFESYLKKEVYTCRNKFIGDFNKDIGLEIKQRKCELTLTNKLHDGRNYPFSRTFQELLSCVIYGTLIKISDFGSHPYWNICCYLAVKGSVT